MGKEQATQWQIAERGYMLFTYEAKKSVMSQHRQLMEETNMTLGTV